MKFFFLCVFLITAFAFGGFCQTSMTGIIRELTGEVELKPEGAANFTRASVGSAVAANTIVSTGFRSSALIEIGNSRITVRPLTRLTLAEIQKTGATETISVGLQAGRIRVDVNPPAGSRSSFKVQTPVATASVRGTSFEVDTTNLTVNKGKVIFSGKAGPAVMVTAGNASFTGADGRPAAPAEVAAISLAPPSPEGTPSQVIITQPSPYATGDIVIGIGFNP